MASTACCPLSTTTTRIDCLGRETPRFQNALRQIDSAPAPRRARPKGLRSNRGSSIRHTTPTSRLSPASSAIGLNSPAMSGAGKSTRGQGEQGYSSPKRPRDSCRMHVCAYALVLPSCLRDTYRPGPRTFRISFSPSECPVCCTLKSLLPPFYPPLNGLPDPKGWPQPARCGQTPPHGFSFRVLLRDSARPWADDFPAWRRAMPARPSALRKLMSSAAVTAWP
jgi:hypothetical protein